MTLARILTTPPCELRHLTQDQLETLDIVKAAVFEILRAPISTLPILSCWDALIDYCHAQLAHSPVEIFHVFYLDRKNRLIADETMARGTVDHVPVYPREVARQALLHNASAVILAHNHPSGSPHPSQADIAMTQDIDSALRILGITLHDHVIVGHGTQTSFRSEGYLQ